MTPSLVSQARTYVAGLLEYCKDYPYHNPAHTWWVYDRATYLAVVEDIGSVDLEDLQLAALFHDTGFTEQYEKNEHIGAKIARKWLEAHHHPEDRIEKIEDIIMATVLFSKPRTHLQCIIQDADLDNIGTNEEFIFSQRYLQELRTIGKTEIGDCAFWQFVYTLLTRYKFHTETAKKERHNQQVLDVQHMETYLTMIGCGIPKADTSTMHDVQ